MKTTEENNRMIAEFMAGGKVQTHHNQYHESWNELMAVVEKIEEDDEIDVNILLNGTIIFKWRTKEDIINNVAMISFDRKIEHVYDAVIQFIEWYNENN